MNDLLVGILKGVLAFWPLYALVLLLLLIISIFGVRRRKSKYIYEKKEYVMTFAEKEFFVLLNACVGDRYWIFPQIHLASIFNHKIPGQSWWGALRHINEKSADFVLCDKASYKIMLAIELDDHSHDRPDRMERDEIVEKIFADAGLPLLRVKSSESKNRDEIMRRISAILAPKA